MIFQAELALEGLVGRIDPLAHATEVAVAVGLVPAVRAEQGQTHRRGELFEVLAGEALVRQQYLPGADEVVVAVQQRGYHGAFPDLGVGQTPSVGWGCFCILRPARGVLVQETQDPESKGRTDRGARWWHVQVLTLLFGSVAARKRPVPGRQLVG